MLAAALMFAWLSSRLMGPALSALFVGQLGETGLMLLASLLLGAALALQYPLMRWHEIGGAECLGATSMDSPSNPYPATLSAA